MATNIELAELMGSLDTAGKTNAQIVVAAYDKLFNREPDTDGMNYWTNRLDTDLSVDDFQTALLDGIRFYEGEFSNEAIADLAITSSKRTVADALVAAGVSGTEASTILASVVDTDSRDTALADIEEANPVDPTDPTNPTDPTEAVTVSLNTKADNVSGTTADDTFYAFVQQNEAGTGAIANALSTGDVITDSSTVDNDVLDATMINDQKTPTTEDFGPMPTVTNVEEIRVQALDASSDTDFDDGVVLDADRITGEEHYASDRSRGDLTITNVNLDADQITKDITIEMDSTQQNSDMAVYFNENDLKAAPDEEAPSSEFFIQVADGNAADFDKPVANIKFDLSFTQGENTYSFEGLSSIDGTYQGLASSIEAALSGKGLSGYSVALGEEFTQFETENKTWDLDYTGNYVTVSDDNGEAFSDVEFTPSQKTGTGVAVILAKSEIDSEVQIITKDVETTIILDNVGRGSNGGELVVGSTSNSNSSTGIEVFNITVENSSVLHDISTTNDDGRTSWDGFHTINLTNGDVKGDFVLTNATYNNAADGMYDNVDNATFKEGLNEFNATNFDGDITLGRDNDIVDLGTLTAVVNGDVTYNATLNDKGDYIASTGNGADTINITLDDNITEANGETDTNVTISTGANNDTITVDEDNNAAEDTTATIKSGTGNDVINGNDVAVTVEAGAGDDAVYVQNTGLKGALKFATSALVDPAEGTPGAVSTAVGEALFLHKSQVQVTLAPTAGTGADEYDVGFESALIEIEGSAANGYLTTEADINTAILKAINEDSVLSKIATASVDNNGDVIVQYLVDGVQTATSLEVEFFAPETTLSTTITNAAVAQWKETYKDSTFAGVADYATAQGSALTAANTIAEALANTTTLLFADVTTGLDNGDTITFTMGDEGETFTYTATSDMDAAAVADAVTALFNEKGYVAGHDTTTAGTVVVNTDLAIDTTINNGGLTGETTTDMTVNGAATGATNTAATSATSAAGKVSTGTDTNSVNGNSGDDVIVLSSAAAVVDTVVLTEYNQGVDTIVHFTSASDKLDLSYYLTNTTATGSASEESQVQFASIAGGADAGVNLTANSVSVVGFNNDFGALLDTATDTEEFSSLTAAKVEAALEDATSSFDTTIDNSLYGTQDGKSILIIENDEADHSTAAAPYDQYQNLGDYMVFEVTYDNTTVAANAATKDFDVKLIGTLDMEDTGSLVATDVLS